MNNYILLLFGLIFIGWSCKNEDNPDNSSFPLANVYKIKDTSYFNYVKAILKKDGNQIGGHIGPNPEFNCKPILIDSSYYYESNYRKTCEFALMSEKTIVLDIRNDSIQAFNTDTMMNHILDREPFIEFYQADYYFIRGCKSLEEDTAKLNEWIRNGELGKHLTRLK